jgi:hypothetical protein
MIPFLGAFAALLYIGLFFGAIASKRARRNDFLAVLLIAGLVASVLEVITFATT